VQEINKGNLLNKLFTTLIKADYMVMILRSTALILVIAISYLIYNFSETKLIGALGILISALLASYSVILNIENTNKNEKLRKYDNKKTNILFLIQNLNDILSILNNYKNIDIGDMKINTYNTILLILEKKINNLEDKDIIKNLLDEEINLLIFIRLKLYENIGILYNYTHSIVIDKPSKFNTNIKFIIKELNSLICLLAKNNNIIIQKMEK
jgi:23S rRNA-/tRNA-specific pseudouridylate synthase